MSAAALRALRTAIDAKVFDPVYYLHGDDEFRKDDAAAQLVEAAIAPGTRDFNLELLRGADVDAARLAVALDALPMLAERRVVVIRDVGSLKKPARAQLARYLAAPARDTLLLLTSPAGTKIDPEFEAAATTVAFAPLGGDKVAPWVVQHARKLGADLSPECAALVADAVGGDLAHAAGELDKLMSYANGRAIEPADVEAVVGVRRGERASDLLDAVAARNAARAVALVLPVLAQPKTTPVSLVMTLTVQALAIAWGCAARDRGVPASRMEPEFRSLFAATRAWLGRSPYEAAATFARNLPKWTSADAARALDQLLAADLALKDSRVSSPEAVVESLVLELCTISSRVA